VDHPITGRHVDVLRQRTDERLQSWPGVFLWISLHNLLATVDDGRFNTAEVGRVEASCCSLGPFVKDATIPKAKQVELPHAQHGERKRSAGLIGNAARGYRIEETKLGNDTGLNLSQN
jgi:hypothetical protein